MPNQLAHEYQNESSVYDQTPSGRRRTPSLSRWSTVGRPVVWTILVAAIGIQVVFGDAKGLTSAKTWSHDQKVVADITVNADKASNPLLDGELIRNSAAFSRDLTHVMRVHHLSVFATSAASYYARSGIPPDLTNVHNELVRPANGATVHGLTLVASLA